MKKKFKRIIATFLTVCALFNFTACSTGFDKDNAITLVQGNIDEIYLGKFNKSYMALTSTTLDMAREAYEQGLEVEAEYFVNYWGIVDADYGESYSDLNESFQNEVIELYKDIYRHSKYEVLSAAKQDNGTFAVKVEVQPIDIMQQAYDLYVNDAYEPLNAFWTKHETTDFSTMSDAEYTAYMYEYGDIIVQMVKDLIPNIGYLDTKSQNIQVQIVDELWTINEDDWAIFDTYVIYYPE